MSGVQFKDTKCRPGLLKIEKNMFHLHIVDVAVFVS